MKKIIISIVFIMSIITITNAQCKTELKAKSEQNCTGIFLLDEEINSGSNEIEVVLRKDLEYGFYLFNEKKGNIPDFKIYNSDKKQIENFKETFNEKQDYRYIEYKASTSEKYTVKFNFDKDEKGCALFTFYLQTDVSKLKK